MKDELFINKPYARIYEIETIYDHQTREHFINKNIVRIYCSQAPDVFTFQIRTHKPITDTGKGKDRNMIASMSLTITEVEEILKHMKSLYSEMKQVNVKPLELIPKALDKVEKS